MTSPFLGAALRYAREEGWSVFPLKPGGKVPLPGTSGHRDATTDLKIIKRWWKEVPDANVGIACSWEMGPLIIDIDGLEGINSLARLDLPLTLEATSGREHRKHLYFSHASERLRRTIKVLPGVDILADGGYVIGVPSYREDTGMAYRWLNDVEPIELTSDLITLLFASKKQSQNGSSNYAQPLPEIIQEGERDTLLTSLAGSMRRRGASQEAILAALREENERRCRPPMPDAQVKKIARSISSKNPAVMSENLTDLGNARRLVRLHGQDIKYVQPFKNPWLVWDDQRWSKDDAGEVPRFAKHVVREMYKEANSQAETDEAQSLLKHAHKSESVGRIKGMIELAATEPEISTVKDIFDTDPWLLNIENGTVDLRTGELRTHRREDLLTRMAPVEYRKGAKHPLWTKFLRTITDGDQGLMDYLQAAVGYSLTGDVREQCLFFCWGSGQNGKSTFLETIRELLGDYSQQAEFSTFLQRRSEGPRNDIARMQGMRFITAVEASGSRHFDEEVLKQLTGGDRVTARRLYEESFEFESTHKLFLAANHKPHINQQTEAIWRRIRLIPFTVYIKPKDRDDELREKLAGELSGILNWALEGCLRWQQDGLHEPERVREATASYREEEDLVGEFFDSECVLDPRAWTKASDLFQGFTNWWRETRGLHAKPPTPQWFGRAVSERKEIKQVKRKGQRGWKGVSTKIRSMR